ncbi:MAG: type II secretion system F family protein [Beijerinckiaceae bacterium]
MDMSALAIAFLAALSVGGIAFVFIYPLLSGDAKAAKRQKAIATFDSRHGEKAARAQSAARREQTSQILKEIETKQKNANRMTFDKRIAQAGVKWTKKGVILGAAGVSGLIFLALFIVMGGDFFVPLGISLIVGFVGPIWLLQFKKNKRLKRFQAEFPNAIDVIVRGVKSGLPLNDCLRIISVEASEPVKSEFQKIIEAQAVGLTAAEACSKLYENMPVTEANFFGIVVAIQSKTGGSLAEAFGNLSKVLRERKKMRGKISAMSMEAKASAAVIAALPFIVVSLLGVVSPGYVKYLFITQAGNMLIAAGLFWMLIGLIIMKKMISFDF